MIARHARRPIPHALACLLLLDLAACGGGGGGGGNGGGGGGGGTPTPTLSSVGVTATAGAVEAGATLQLKATASYSDASTRDVTTQSAWTSSNDTIATVSNAGLVTARAAGTVNVTAAFEGKSGALSVLVNPPPLVARFAVKTGRAGDRDVCRMKDDGDLDCYFDGGESGPDATRWTGTWAQGSARSDAIVRNVPTVEPNTNCGLFDTDAPQAGTGFVQMIVTLRVRDAAGRESPVATNGNVRLYPDFNCNFGF